MDRTGPLRYSDDQQKLGARLGSAAGLGERHVFAKGATAPGCLVTLLMIGEHKTHK